MITYDPLVPPLYYDTETVGLHGPIVLFQYAIGRGPIHLVEVWRQPIQATIDLLRMVCEHPGGVVGFNLAFDHFHVCQMATTLLLMDDPSKNLEDCISEYALKEPEGRDGPCLKPVRALDLMMFARKGPYQSAMRRAPIRIRRVPAQLSYLLANELDQRIPIADIYFSRQKVRKRWHTLPIEDAAGDIDPEFRDVVLSFDPSSGLKAIAEDALKGDDRPEGEMGEIDHSPHTLAAEVFKGTGSGILKFDDIKPDCPAAEEIGYAPYALAVGKPGAWNGAWPDVIRTHIDHWAHHEQARIYAEKDIVYTRGLHDHFGRPELGCDDSELTCMVGAVRWKGFRIDPAGIEMLKVEAQEKIADVPTASSQAKPWIFAKLSPAEIVAAKGSTKKTVLEALVKQVGIRCEACDATGQIDETPCDRCGGDGLYTHPAAERAQLVLEARKGKYEVNFYNKLLLAGRLHASFEVIGALSSRMSGSGGGLNSQGIKRSKEVRKQFPLAWPGFELCGGDFAGFEVVLAEAAYNDPDLHRDLLYKRPCAKCTKGNSEDCPRCHGGGVVDRDTESQSWCPTCLVFNPAPKCDDCWGTGLADTKIHAMFGMCVYPGMTYEQILNDKERYTRCKSAVFAMLYGGEGFTLQERLGVPIEIADAAHRTFCRKYPGVGRAQKRIESMFCTLSQAEGGGSITWSEPADYIDSLFGFRRYFTLENKIAKALFDLAQRPPQSWRKLKLRVTRSPHKGEQSASGAAQSALFGAAFQVQASSKRAAGNHEIQSSGATVTKFVQRKIWDHQPTGIGPWSVMPMNVHDEVICPCVPEIAASVKETVDAAVESFRPKVPLIKLVWSRGLKTWADK